MDAQAAEEDAEQARNQPALRDVTLRLEAVQSPLNGLLCGVRGTGGGSPTAHREAETAKAHRG